jgi:hypothetical protein
MENNSNEPEELNEKKGSNQEETEFENNNVDPGFNADELEEGLEGEEDERSGNIDVDTSISEMRHNAKNDSPDKI